jgi:hypothetical protein
MARRTVSVLLVLLVSLQAAVAKDKKKGPLSADILQAHTALVLVDPSAGVDAADANANRLARVAVEQVMDKWGRFVVVREGYPADIIIMVRKGNGKMLQTTIGGTPVNGAPPGNVDSATTPNQTTTRTGARWPTGDQPANPLPQIEADPAQDTFAVYRGGKEDPKWSPLGARALWHYTAKDALDPPSVPAVEAFRKAVAESEKQLAANPGP